MPFPSSPTRCQVLRETHGWNKIELAVASKTSVGVIDRMEAATAHEDIECMYVGSFVAVAHALGVAPATLYPILGMRSPE